MSLYIAACDKDLYYVVCRFYFFPITSSYKAYFLRTNRSIGRYGGHSWKNWFKGCLEAQVVSLLGAWNLASMRGKGKLNMLDDP